MTATNRLMSQKFRTMIHTMKKKQETKYSESIIWYMSGDHCKIDYQQEILPRMLSTYSISRRHNEDLKRSKIYRVETCNVGVRILWILLAHLPQRTDETFNRSILSGLCEVPLNLKRVGVNVSTTCISKWYVFHALSGQKMA